MMKTQTQQWLPPKKIAAFTIYQETIRPQLKQLENENEDSTNIEDLNIQITDAVKTSQTKWRYKNKEKEEKLSQETKYQMQTRKK